MTHVPVVKQPPHLCWSYALAQMIDAWRFSHGQQPPMTGYEARTSGFELAVAFAADKHRELYSQGSVSAVDSFLRERHPYVCDDREISRDGAAEAPDQAFADRLLKHCKLLPFRALGQMGCVHEVAPACVRLNRVLAEDNDVLLLYEGSPKFAGQVVWKYGCDPR